MTPRSLAQQRGDKYYLGGKPCRVHGIVSRQTNNGSCVECQRHSHKDWLVDSGEQEYPSAYHDGRRHRSKDRPKKPPQSKLSPDYYWWMAGWNDRDMELTT